ncbi:MAG: helix-turn-helix transcriptional regulator [Arcobacter sp.]|jgi:transcriptional regulator with XRE-family HTH domain|uniref:helix-turn-helix domain-containing protein n=1 Tax=Arcobacter sp. TaxID=1872629 RepID=UPI002A755A3F|nr:helix-turn-helix transcriptional regulator [Arcobacter sp.]MDY3201232.1 helix-turn-helix transcriptional regulator [Arcobacter sp.]
MLAINISTPKSIMQDLKDKFKQKRLSLNLTQEGLSNKSGVSLGSIKRFETSGEISFESLLKIALVLNCLDDFKNIANKKDEQYDSMDDLLKIKPIKKRGAIK